MKIINQSFFQLAMLVGFVAIDLVSKKVAENFPQLIHYNYGFYGGSFVNLDIFFRVVMLGSIGVFLIALYLFLLYLYQGQSAKLLSFITCFLSGVLGNGIERLFTARTTDFIPIPSFLPYAGAYNVADIIMALGAIGLIYILLFKDKEVWYPGNKRSKIFVYTRDQLIFSLKIVMTNLIFGVLLFVLNYGFLKYFVPQSLTGPSPFGIRYLYASAILQISFMGLLFLISLYISHRYFGPIKALINYLKRRQFNEKFKLRKNDHLKFLEEEVNKLNENNS